MTPAEHEPRHEDEPEPIHSGTEAHIAFVDRLLLPAWVVAMGGFLFWLITLGVNV